MKFTLFTEVRFSSVDVVVPPRPFGWCFFFFFGEAAPPQGGGGKQHHPKGGGGDHHSTELNLTSVNVTKPNFNVEFLI